MGVLVNKLVMTTFFALYPLSSGGKKSKEGERKDDNILYTLNTLNTFNTLNTLKKGRKEKNKFALLIFFLSFS
jgi:hypothetical protein